MMIPGTSRRPTTNSHSHALCFHGNIPVMSETRKNSWTIWVAAALLLMLVAYPLSIGPTMALFTSSYAQSVIESMGPMGQSAVGLAVGVVYWPLAQIATTFPDTIGAVIQGYIHWWAPDVFIIDPPIPASAPLPAAPLPGSPVIDSL